MRNSRAVRTALALGLAAGGGVAAWLIVHQGVPGHPSPAARGGGGGRHALAPFRAAKAPQATWFAPTAPRGPFAAAPTSAIISWGQVWKGEVWREGCMLRTPGRVESAALRGVRKARLYVGAAPPLVQGENHQLHLTCVARTPDGRTIAETAITVPSEACDGSAETWREVALDLAAAGDAPVTLAVSVQPESDDLQAGLCPIAVSTDLEPATPPQTGPNCLIILADALRSDLLTCYGFPAETTPTLDRLAAQGVLFEKAMSVSSWTVPCIASLFTGTYPSTHGMTELEVPGRLSLPTLAEELQRIGVRTLGVSATTMVDPSTGLGAGFDEFVTSPGMLESRLPAAGWVVDHAIEMLRRNQGRRFFMYLHFMDTHEPWGPPEEFRHKFRENSASLYAACACYMDREIGRLLAELDRLGRSADTLVIVLADHGEALGERNKSGHGESVHREEIQIPLLVRDPEEAPAGRRVRSQVRIIDVYPTVAERMGLPVPRWVEGESLRPLWSDRGDSGHRPAFAELHPSLHQTGPPQVTLSDGAYRLILYLEDGRRALYDLEADPNEQKDIAKAQPARTAALERKIRQFLRERRRATRRPTPLSEEAKRRLRALGYLVPGDP
jgi:arylsulfatase A-like enzyme